VLVIPLSTVPQGKGIQYSTAEEKETAGSM
jgi:hypothetical protein